MQHKGRQSKPNSPLLLQSDCSLLASVLLFFVLEIRISLALWAFFPPPQMSFSQIHCLICWRKDNRDLVYRQIAKCNFVQVLSWLYFWGWSLDPQQCHRFLFHIMCLTYLACIKVDISMMLCFSQQKQKEQTSLKIWLWTSNFTDFPMENSWFRWFPDVLGDGLVLHRLLAETPFKGLTWYASVV